MQIFVIKLRIFLTRSQIDSYLFDRVRVMKILCMLTKIYRYKEVALYLNIKRFLWVRSWCLLDEYVIWQGSRISLREILLKHLVFLHYAADLKDSPFMLLWFSLTFYLSYVASIYVMYLCSIFSKPFSTKTIQIKGLIRSELYNSDKLHAFRNIKSRTPQ